MPRGLQRESGSLFSLDVFLAYSPLHVHLYYSTNFTHSCVYINNAEVTVNTCICTDVFTVITTKHQQKDIYALWLHGIAVACTQYVSTFTSVCSEEIHCSRSDTHNSTIKSKC